MTNFFETERREGVVGKDLLLMYKKVYVIDTDFKT